MATDTMSLMERCGKLVKQHGGGDNTTLATLLLACQMHANNVLAAEPAKNQAPVAVSAPPTAKGLGILTMASNGDKFDDFLQKYGDKSLDEAANMVDTGKWTEKDYDMFVKYQDQKDIMMNLSIDTTNELKKRAAMKSAEKKWGEIAPLLSKMSPDKVITFLKSDSEGYKKLLQYIVDNQLPPPGYASELLKKLENA